jgi:hypothetical protein
MTRIIDYSVFFFKKRDIFFSEFPYDNGDKFDIVTFNYCKNRINFPGYICEEKLTATINLRQELEEIWNKMDRRLRQKIKKAKKENIVWKINKNYDEFYKISKDFAHKKNFTTHLGAYLNLDLPTERVMKKFGTLFTSELNGEILSGHLYLEDDENILAWVSTSKRLVVDKETSRLINNANCLLHWEAINYAKEKSIGTFNWGGISQDPKMYSINHFKLSFGGLIEPSYFYTKINNKYYEKLSNINTKLKKMID